MGIAEASSRPKKNNDKDFYQTPLLCVEALIKKFPFIKYEKTFSILDPCEGGKSIGRILDKYDIPYLGLDKYPVYDDTLEQDFLTYNGKHDVIIMNPPYKLKNEFIEHALTIADRVFAILPTNVLNYNHFHRNFLDRQEYIGRLLLTPKFFMSTTLNEDDSLDKGGVSSYFWGYWCNTTTKRDYSFERYLDLDVLKRELDNEKNYKEND